MYSTEVAYLSILFDVYNNLLGFRENCLKIEKDAIFYEFFGLPKNCFWVKQCLLQRNPYSL